MQRCSAATAMTWSTFGVMVPAEKILQTAIAEKCDINGPSGLDHAVAGRDGPRRQEMQRQNFQPPLISAAPPLEGAYRGGERSSDPCRLATTRWSTSPTPAGRRGRSACCPRSRRPTTWPAPRRLRGGPRTHGQPAQRPQPMADQLRTRSIANKPAFDYLLVNCCRRRLPSTGVRCSTRSTSRRARRVHRSDAVLHFWDLAGKYPRILTRRGGRRGRHLVVQRRPGDAEEADRRWRLHPRRSARCSASAGQPGRARRPGGLRRRRRDPRHAAPPAAADN